MEHLETVLDMPRDQVGILEKRLIRSDSVILDGVVKSLNTPKNKTRHDVMLDSISDHENEDEIAKIINSEFQVDMVEIASGNGKYHTEWNPDELPMAQANEQSPHDRSGLAEQFLDVNGECINKNYVDVFDKGTGQIVSVENSRYSIWDTIYQKGQLIVRTTAPWKSGFNPIRYISTKTRNLKIRHNKLLGLNAKFEKKVMGNYQERMQKRLDRIQARMGGSMAKVGYNAYPV